MTSPLEPYNQKHFAEEMAARERQHAKGKLTARERLALLLDAGSFVELRALATSQAPQNERQKIHGDGVITGFGTVDGARVYLYAQDVTQMGGSLGAIHADKIVQVYEEATQQGCPIIGLIDSGGARIQEGVASLDGYGAIFNRAVRASGVIPQLSIILGPAAGGAAYAPALTDFVCLVEGQGTMFITGPAVIKAATGEMVDFEELGGSRIHGSKSGVAQFVTADEGEAFALIRRLLGFLPSNNLASSPRRDSLSPAEVDWVTLVPSEPAKTYDIRRVIAAVVDVDSFFEVQAAFAANAVVGFARLDGQVIGLVANQPKVLAGCLDIAASGKISRFVQFCDAFVLPIVNLVDVPGYLPGVQQEHEGIIRHGAKVLYAYASSTVPKVAVVLRKAYGGGYIALASRALGYDRLIAWPGAELAVMGAEQAVDVIHRKTILEQGEGYRQAQIEAYQAAFLNPFHAAEQGRVDMIIEPAETRQTLIRTLEALAGKRVPRVARKHGNQPQ